MGTLERLALDFHRLSFVDAVAWMVAINLTAFAAALTFGQLVIRLCGSRYAFAKPPPLTGREVALALSVVAANTVVNVAGYLMWKAGWIRIRPDSLGRALIDFAILFITMDFLMYGLHRLAHHRWFYPWLHSTHHRYENPRPLTLFVMNPLEALAFGALWLSILLVYSPTWIGMAAFLSVNLASGMLGHVGVNPYPANWSRIPVLGVISTSVFHNAHHRDPGRNLGFYTTLWDRLFGTRAEDGHYPNRTA